MTITISGGGLNFSGGGISIESGTPAVSYGSGLFNGTSQYLSITSPPANLIAWATGNFTVEYWVNPAAFSQGGNGESNIIGNMDAATTGTYWSFGPVIGGTVKFYYYNGGTVSFSTSVAIQANVWTHLAFVNNAGALTIYINGISSATSSILGTPLTGAELPFTIGSSNSVRFDGLITNVRIVNGAAVYTSDFTPPTTNLGATQSANTNGNPSAAITGTQSSLVLDMITSGNFLTDSSTNGFTVTNNGAATWSSLSPY